MDAGTPGQTNSVSLKKLMREAGEAVSDDSSDEDSEDILSGIVLDDLYATKAECYNFKQIKMDINVKMIRLQAPSLNVKLAELWPKGTMDKHEIRKAICRAKEREMVLW